MNGVLCFQSSVASVGMLSAEACTFVTLTTDQDQCVHKFAKSLVSTSCLVHILLCGWLIVCSRVHQLEPLV